MSTPLWAETGPRADLLARLVPSPVARRQLQEYLTAEELDYFLTPDEYGCCCAVEKVALTDRELADIRELIAAERDAVEAAASLDRVEETAAGKAMIAEECRRLKLTPLEERLYRLLRAEGRPEPQDGPEEWELAGLWESTVIWHVWPLDAYSRLTKKQQATYSNRLRGLCCALSNKLLIGKSPLKVGRKYGRVALVERTEKTAPAAEQPRKRQSTPCEPSPADKPPTVEECVSLIREYLAAGPKEPEALRSHCEKNGCRPTTIRNAKAQLKVRLVRRGFGGKCLVCLSA